MFEIIKKPIKKKKIDKATQEDMAVVVAINAMKITQEDTDAIKIEKFMNFCNNNICKIESYVVVNVDNISYSIKGGIVGELKFRGILNSMDHYLLNRRTNELMVEYEANKDIKNISSHNDDLTYMG